MTFRRFLTPFAMAAVAFSLAVPADIADAQAQARSEKEELKKQRPRPGKKKKPTSKPYPQGKVPNAVSLTGHRRVDVPYPACCNGDCDAGQNLTVFYAGKKDNFNTSDGTEITTPRPALQDFMDQYNNGIPPNREFDDSHSDRVLGHTFMKLPQDIVCATLEVSLKGLRGQTHNETISLYYDGPNSFAWGIGIDDLPQTGGSWNTGQNIVLRLDLANLPLGAGASNIIPSINAGNLLDVYVQDDTAVDYMILSVVTYAGKWSNWLDRDNVGGKGDYEYLSDLIKEGHLKEKDGKPICIQCQTLEGVDWKDAGEVYQCDPEVGGVCINADQPDGRCMDYRVRFLYPQ